MRLPALNALVECTWTDILGQINSPLTECKPVQCVTVGRLAVKEKDHIVLVTSQYENDGETPVVDATAIPLGVIQSCRKITL